MKINKLCFFTSALLMTMIAPGFADIANNAESATCNSDTIGVSDGSTVLEAQWTAQQIQCSAGQYLESDTAQCTSCPAGSYCEGGLYTFSGSDLGITSACPENYTSDGSAASTADCYRECTTSDVAHSLTVSGKYYYGDNNQCGATSCAVGYTQKDAFDFSTYQGTTPTGSLGVFKGDEYSTDGTVQPKEYYDINGGYEWGIDLTNGVIHGVTLCSTMQGDNNNKKWTNPTTFENLTDETGQEGAWWCYCKITGFKNTENNEWINLSSPWIIVQNLFDNNYRLTACPYWCPHHCAYYIYQNSSFRNALFSIVKPNQPSCSANTIGITWKPENGEENIQNQCSYDGSVTIPDTPSKVGYDFNGWKVNNAQ